ncbi:MAG: 30S ribosomal protein S2 [Acidobacteriota bacterium]|nr:30S ribosomal protein S2 [Acidobacteriota bacterium]
MLQVTMRNMLEAGVHFGHQTRRWNPKMKRYIFGKRGGIYIIDLQQTAKLLEEAVDFARSLGAAGQRLLFVGTKRQAQDVIAQEATRCGQYYVTHRWLGGMLTNYVTIRRSIERLQEIEDRLADAATPLLKKEKIRLDREYAKTDRNLRGIRGMEGLPDALFVVDPKREHIAVAEANKLGIPVIAIVDTNCDPEEVDFVIPGNDDAIRTIRLFARALADAYLEGAKGLAEAIEQAEKDAAEDAGEAPAPLEVAAEPERPEPVAAAEPEAELAAEPETEQPEPEQLEAEQLEAEQLEEEQLEEEDESVEEEASR